MTELTESKQSVLDIEERKGAVIIKLTPQQNTRKMNYAILPPDQAKEVGEVLQRYAYHAKYGSDPQTKSLQAEQIRAKMQTRVAHVIRSLEQKNRPPAFIANEIVNVLLSEVL